MAAGTVSRYKTGLRLAKHRIPYTRGGVGGWGWFLCTRLIVRQPGRLTSIFVVLCYWLRACIAIGGSGRYSEKKKNTTSPPTFWGWRENSVTRVGDETRHTSHHNTLLVKSCPLQCDTLLRALVGAPRKPSQNSCLRYTFSRGGGARKPPDRPRPCRSERTVV